MKMSEILTRWRDGQLELPEEVDGVDLQKEWDDMIKYAIESAEEYANEVGALIVLVRKSGNHDDYLSVVNKVSGAMNFNIEPKGTTIL